MPENKPINIDDLNLDKGVYYKSNPDEPYSGPLEETGTHSGFIKDGLFSGIITNAHPSTKPNDGIHPLPVQKALEANFKDGKKEGLTTMWHENGQKKFENNFKDGIRSGLGMAWYENGIQEHEVNYKDGKKNGLESWWHENGYERTKINYKDDKQDGLESYWYENGQKHWESNTKDGNKDGLESWWHESGYKESETNYKSGLKNGFKIQWSDGYDKPNRIQHFKDGQRTFYIPGQNDLLFDDFGFNNIESLIRDKIISVNISDSSPNFTDQAMNLFKNESPVDYIKQVIEENGTSIISLYDETKHQEFERQIDAKYPNS
jgi:antitoxin component YwqK of YwqJK toxin-antitoxin module